MGRLCEVFNFCLKPDATRTSTQTDCVRVSGGHIESDISNIDIFVNIDIVSKPVIALKEQKQNKYTGKKT